MSSLNNSYGTGWVCVTTGADFAYYSEDRYGRTVVHCECDGHCLKGLTVEQTQPVNPDGTGQ